MRSTRAEAQPDILTLTCNGTMSSGGDQPISILMMLNLANRTVRGIGLPGLIDYPIRITTVDDKKITFSSTEAFSHTISSVAGTVDRETGDLEATSTMADEQTLRKFSGITYVARCKTL